MINHICFSRLFFKNLRKTSLICQQQRFASSRTSSEPSSLSDQQEVYELQIHLVRPHLMQSYLKEMDNFVNVLRTKSTEAELVGSFTCEIGPQDEAIHLWRYNGGNASYQQHYRMYRSDPDLMRYRAKRNEMLRSRRNQLCLRFAFWPNFPIKEGNHVYELRTYDLKAGTLLEWSNYWANGLNIRNTDNSAVVGLFSQLGGQQQVQHLWRYSDLAQRDVTRDNAWRHPSWADTVRRTVSLIRSMSCIVLKPTPFSPAQ